MNFEASKNTVISKIDFSRKGSIDEKIKELVSYINNCDHFFTTSSCSGRICLFEENPDLEVKKKGCIWLYTTHEDLNIENLLDGLKQSRYSASLKFEPFILHVQCKTIEDAQLMHKVAIGSGFRNSGISIAKNKKIICAVRSTHSLQVPLTKQGQSLVSEEYLKYLCELLNEKVKSNCERTKKFFADFQAEIEQKRPQVLL